MADGVRYHCTRCRSDFEGEEERCPKCLRTSTVRSAEAVATERWRAKARLLGDPAAGKRGALAFLLRFAVGALLFGALTWRGRLLSVSLESTAMRVYACLLGGALLAAAWSLLALKAAEDEVAR